MTLQGGEITPRLHWPNKPLETMFTGNSDDNQLPHSSVLARTDMIRAAGNYQERAVGLGADDYHLWYRLFKVGAKFVRDDAVRNVVYRIHEKNSLNIRRARRAMSSIAGSMFNGACWSMRRSAHWAMFTAWSPTRSRSLFAPFQA